MLYALICTDKPHAEEVRKENRDDHLAFLKAMGSKLKAAGPFMDDHGGMTGSLIVLEAGNRDEVLAIAGEDPYARAGLFESVEIRPWNWVINNPEA